MDSPVLTNSQVKSHGHLMLPKVGLGINAGMKAIGCVRVSTEKQAELGVSLEAQSEEVRAMAVVQGEELAEVYGIPQPGAGWSWEPAAGHGVPPNPLLINLIPKQGGNKVIRTGC